MAANGLPGTFEIKSCTARLWVNKHVREDMIKSAIEDLHMSPEEAEREVDKVVYVPPPIPSSHCSGCGKTGHTIAGCGPSAQGEI